MEKPETLSLYDFFKKFPDEEAARLYFEKRRWATTKACPHCGSLSIAEVKDHKPMPYRCKDCRKHFSVRTGTTLEESRLPLQKWLMVIYMMTTARKGIPSTQMARELGITQKSAWFLAQRIRESWLSKKEPGSAGDGEVRAQVIAAPSALIIQAAIRQSVEVGSVLCTDEHSAYVGMPEFAHYTVKHSAKQFVDGMAHTNSIESFWALLKRGYYGIYHHMSTKHLHRYVNEFSFRHNTAAYGTLPFIDATVQRMNSRRLTYKELTHG